VQGVTLADVVAASGGRLAGELSEATVFPRVEVDPGKVASGDLFVAVPGEEIDGHEFTVVAALRGAAAAIVARSWAERLRERPLPLVVVEDEPVAALQRIAAARRETLTATVVGVTGSVGKTSTKDAVAAVAARRFRTGRSPGNRNNELGLPLSVLEADESAEVLVLELGGAFAYGEIELLARIAKPRIGVVTNVFPIHLERMGSIDAIAETKAELVEAVPPDGAAVLNGDDPRVRAMAARCRGDVVFYGRSAASEVRAEAVRLHGLDGCSFRARVGGQVAEARLPLVGGHAVEVALAALAVGHVLRMPLEEMLPGLDDTTIQTRVRRVPGPRGSLLLDDTYNASRPSVLSALQVLECARARRRVAVLGDMLELGALAEREHAAVGRRAARVLDVLLTYGELAEVIAEAARRASGDHHRAIAVTSFATGQQAELVDFLRSDLREGDLVLVKGSRALRMEMIVEALATAPGSAAPAESIHVHRAGR
jgi:UDP-N-acetylmuramoyl-tripeptide--D-alanyl-D-alanine ligase